MITSSYSLWPVCGSKRLWLDYLCTYMYIILYAYICIYTMIVVKKAKLGKYWTTRPAMSSSCYDSRGGQLNLSSTVSHNTGYLESCWTVLVVYYLCQLVLHGIGCPDCPRLVILPFSHTWGKPPSVQVMQTCHSLPHQIAPYTTSLAYVAVLVAAATGSGLHPTMCSCNFIVCL